ncbi:class II aldolase/adducin family protein [Polaromonas sp.]|uniref:class II aldolase/adducin family protein n=1 Tax=Polaromonas sp. TaxID=1869339 RepID=UPI002FCAEBA4
MTENQAREEICRIGQSLFERGYVHATAGNISVRLDDGFLITPTDACLGFLDPAKLARLDASAKQFSGEPASKTIALHAGIYRAAARFDAQTSCVIHTHSTHCVGLSLQAAGAELLPQADKQRELLPAVTPYFVMKVGHVPLIPYHRPGDPQAAALVAQTIVRYGEQGAPIRAVMLERLGPNVWHQTPAAAMATLEELEETARLCLLAHPKPEPLTETQIDELRQTFGARW